MRKNRLHRRMWLAPVAAILLFASLPAHAGMVLSISSVTDAPGTNGDSFDVTIQNTGTSAQNIAAFDLGLSVTGSIILFTGANESTADVYLFNGDSFDIINAIPFASIPPPNGQSVQASDLSNSGTGTNIAAGATLGLGHIIFNVAAGAGPGPITVTLASTCASPSSCTDLSNSGGDAVAFSVNSGTITISGTSVPEPASGVLAGLALIAIVAGGFRKRAVR